MNVEDELLLIETVTREETISKQHRDTIFGKTRVLKGRKGSVLVLQFSFQRCTRCSIQIRIL
jgi:hypothetical protein